MINRLHGGNIRGKGLIDFSVNINPLGLPPQIKKLIAKNIDSILCYPEADSNRLKEALGRFHNISKDNILIGNGSIELIYLLPKALNAKRVLIPQPAFTEYEFASRVAGAKVYFSAKPGLKVDMVFLCNPNNPTGAVLNKHDILSHNAKVVVDEAFIDFVEDSDKITMLPEAVKNRNILVLRSLTKFFAVPGLRLGYLVGHKDIIKRVSNFQHPWNVNSLAQLIGEEIIKDKEYIRKSKEFIFKEREFLFKSLKNIKNLEPYLPTSNFIFCRLKNATADQLYRRLFERGIVIRKCGNFRGLDDRFFRVAVRKRPENIKLIKEVEKCLRTKTKRH